MISLDEKCATLRTTFRPLLGDRLTSYATAEIFVAEDQEWSAWDDLPIRLYWASGAVTSVSWTKFDELILTPDESLPAWLKESSQLRWVENGLTKLNFLLGSPLQGVELGKGEMSVEGRELDVWTRVILQFDAGWLEIYDALDQNGYAVHRERPAGVKRTICPKLSVPEP